jgi:magnesium transporter
LRVRPLHELRSHAPGEPAGIDHLANIDSAPPPGEVMVEMFDYDADHFEARTAGDLEDLEQFLFEDRFKSAKVRWIDVLGLHPYVVNRLRLRHGFHTLAAEDVLHVPQRPRVEVYDGHLFVVTHFLSIGERGLQAEQLSIFLFEDTVLSFQEFNRSSLAPLRARLEVAGTKLRKGGAGFLVYVMLDMVVDHCFPLLERFHDVLDDLEDEVMDSPKPAVLQKIQDVKRDLAAVRRVVWPTRDLLDQLIRGEHKNIGKSARVYLRDVQGHAVHLVDTIETLRELAGNLTDLYMSVNSNRMNETMKVLTIIASLFIPITFLAGVYGMNFEHMPELDDRWAYPSFWVVCLLVSAGLLTFFYRRGWLGGDG